MIRECKASDLETLEVYLKEEVYGKVILSLIEKNGFDGGKRADRPTAASGQSL